jgi:zinc transport system ATP-binding protein
MSTLINLEKINFQRDGRVILDHINVELAAGRITTLIGPNGAGKTTLVKLVLGLLKPDSGSIKKNPDLRIGYMPQKLTISQTMPISVHRFLALTGCGTEKVDEALREVNAFELRNTQFSKISGGELQRILLARALLREPQLLVLDEPVQGVDINGQAELYELIAEIRDRHGCGILMVSHDLHVVMAKSDDVICLNHHICCHGHPESVSRAPEYLALFGASHANSIALYQHHHDHQHDLHGDIVDEKNSHVHGKSCQHDHHSESH